MFKFVTIYRQVEEPNLLEEFFSQTHLPLAEQLPNLLRSEVGRVEGKPGGESRFHLMFELYFENRRAFEEALATEVGVQFMAALKPWADEKLISWFYADAFLSDS